MDGLNTPLIEPASSAFSTPTGAKCLVTDLHRTFVPLFTSISTGQTLVYDRTTSQAPGSSDIPSALLPEFACTPERGASLAVPSLACEAQRPPSAVIQAINGIRFHDAIFISLDCAGVGSDKGPSDIGVSFLDSRYFASLHNAKLHTHPILPTYHSCLSRKGRAKRRAKKRLRLGDMYDLDVNASNRSNVLKRVLTHILPTYESTTSQRLLCISNNTSI